MTLRRKMSLQITAMIVGLLLISGVSLWGLNGLQQNYGAAVQGYLQLRHLFEVASELATARSQLTAPEPDADRAIMHVQGALTRLEGAEPPDSLNRASYEPIRAELRETLAELRGWRMGGGGSPPTDGVNRVLKQISDKVADVRRQIVASQEAAENKRRTTMTVVGAMCGVIILSAVILGLWQYRSVLKPLNRLGAAVRRVATGQFGVRILEDGMPSGKDNEFARLAADFNRMASELDGFYRDLEQKVAAKSKELIRSERLASVGYLAAGVAHEINNPLGIISGYAEYALGEMRSGKPAADAVAEIDGTLRVIRDEAFRCKDITSKLLSLARPGEGKRQPVNLAEAAEHVVSVLAGLRDFKERTITVRAESREPLVVDAIDGEIKQVLMNLLLNALEATDDGTGEVRVTIARDNAHVTLSVSDNGRGMSEETLERVFEPFFTDRRQRDPEGAPAAPRPGTGLGLSITHAIVAAHGGRITAHSDGPGRGSRFVIELPAAAATMAVASR